MARVIWEFRDQVIFRAVELEAEEPSGAVLPVLHRSRGHLVVFEKCALDSMGVESWRLVDMEEVSHEVKWLLTLFVRSLPDEVPANGGTP
jgi:hypothetical protein